jgi:hypothetical protein
VKSASRKLSDPDRLCLLAATQTFRKRRSPDGISERWHDACCHPLQQGVKMAESARLLKWH